MQHDQEEIVRRRLKEEGPGEWYHSIEVIPGSGVFTPGKIPARNFDAYLRAFDIAPEFLKGRRVLDIGAYTGADSFAFEERGADVVSLDIHDPRATGYALIHELRQSHAEHRKASVYDLNSADFGHFDLIWYSGVFYHLKHPILALERINSVCKNNGLLLGGGTTCDAWFHNDAEDCASGVNLSKICAQSVADEQAISVDSLNDLPLCGFARTHYYQDTTNWFIPNVSCLEAWFKRTGFRLEIALPKTTELPRDWNKKGVVRSLVNFKATRIGEPEPEYHEEEYHYNKRLNFEPIHRFRIPVENEVRKLQRRVEELEKKVTELEERDV